MDIKPLIDLYEMSMANGYFADKSSHEKVVFDLFFRKNPDGGGFAIFAGLEQILDIIENLHFDDETISYLRSLGIFSSEFLKFLKDYKFKGDISSVREGTIVYPNEPLITVTASLIDAQIIETLLLSQINHQSLIATKASRIVRAANGLDIYDFGARRAHNADAAIYGARAAYIGGVKGTATLMAGQMFGMPVIGTMAHSWVMYYEDEFLAFKKFAEIYPDNAVLLVDTYDVLRSGVPNAIRVAKEVLEPMGKRLKGVRIDSGDLAYLSAKIRVMLDDAGLNDCKITASNSLDEYTIGSIINQGGKFDSFGVGERLITAKSDPVFGAVYKMAGVVKNGVCEPRIKISESVEKITNPGQKRLYRIYDASGYAVADLITMHDEELDLSKPYRYIDPNKPWKNQHFTNCTAKELQILVMKDGKRVLKRENLKDIQNHVKHQLECEIWLEEQRFENPHIHYLDMSPSYYQMKMSLLDKMDRS